MTITSEKPAAWLRQAVARHQRGDLAGAEPLYRKVVQAQPRNPQALGLLGSLLVQAGRSGEALPILERALAAQPQAPEAHYWLGAAHQFLGQMDQAQRHLKQAIDLRPDHAQALHGLGVVLQTLGRPEEALPHFDRVLALKPASPVTLLQRGLARKQAGDLEGAIDDLKVAVSRQRDNPRAHAVLGEMLQEAWLLDEAVAHLKQWTRLSPDDPGAHAALGAALRLRGDLKAADPPLRRALELEPQHTGALTVLAHVLREKGEFQEAYDMLRSALNGGHNAALVAALGPVARSLGKQDEALELIEAVLDEGGLDPTALQALHHQAGHMLDRKGEYDAAFAHFQKGNGARPNPFDPNAHETYIDGLIEAFSATAMRRIPKAAHAFQLPVFVVGMPRSGTTLVEQIIASHPQAEGVGELMDIGNLAMSLPRRLGASEPFPRCVEQLDRATLDRLAEGYLARLRSLAPDASRVVDKMPHNFRYLGLINLLFPKARVIHCRRDPVDTCLSCYFQDFTGSHDYARDLAILGRYYRQYERLMAHWRKVLSLPVLEVRYEDMVADQERMSREIIAFLGLPWDDACLHFYKTRREVATASFEQVRRPVYKSSVQRWRKYERHLGPLLAALKHDA